MYTFITDKIIDALVWKEEEGIIEWCKDNIYLNQDVTPYTGMISFEKTPWIEEILRDWDKPWIEQFNIMASTQVGKTTIEFCCISKELDTDPCMMQLTLPTDDGVGDFVKTKFDPFFRGIKSLQSKMDLYKSEEKLRQKGAIKEVSNGMLFILGNTDKNRRSKTVKKIFIDEASLFGKGHIKELIGRTKFFEKTGRKIFIVSSRKYKGDEIEIAYENSYCKKELQILCKGCNEYFYPTSKHFKYMSELDYKNKYELSSIENFNNYKREAKETAHVLCQCEHKTTSEDLEDLVRQREVALVVVEGSDEDTIHGYKLNALATALTKYSTIAEGLIEAGDDPEELQTIYQDYFNETYEFNFIEKEQSDMFLLGNGIKEWKVPKDTLRIYLTIDNQLDHLYAQVTAIGYKGLVHIVFFGRVETWSQAEEMWDICQNLEDELGERCMVSKMGIDRRGYNQGQVSRTDEADQFVHYMTQKWGEDRIYGMEGHPTLAGGKSFAVVNHKDHSKQRKELKVKIIKFSNLYIKNQLFRSIDRTILKAKAKQEEDEGFNYTARLLTINQDNIDRDMEYTKNDSITKMLSAEIFDYAKDHKTGRLADTKSWIAVRKRNDAIDTTSMAITLGEMDLLSLIEKPNSDFAEAKKTFESIGSMSFQ